MISRSTIAVSLGIIIYPVVNNLIFGIRSGEGLTGIVCPGSRQFPAFSRIVNTDNVYVMTAVVTRIIPSALVYAFYLSLRPRKRVRQPARESSLVFSYRSLNTISLALTAQYKPLDFYLRVETLAVAVVCHIVYYSPIALQRYVVHLVGGHSKQTGAQLVCNLWF